MKIAFYIPNKNISKTDLSNVDNGNPGIGGSEYSAILIASKLNKTGSLDITLLCDKKAMFPEKLNYVACGCLEKAMFHAKANKFDYVVVDAKLLKEHILVLFYEIKFIAWANCFIEEKDQHLFAKHTNIIKIVNVGKHQHLLLKDTCIGHKSTYIFNAVPTSILQKFENKIIPINKRKNSVVYIGSIHKAKGFHCLAKIWPEILKEIPDAQLYVIGSGHLYGYKSKLGEYGIAQKEYENEFMPYITLNGKILPSVHFMGVLGADKYKILNECKVGVPNPCGISETFGYTAVEMEMMGCLVTTIKCPGYLDTVYDKSNLYNDTAELKSFVIRLLKENSLDYNATLNFISEFNVDKITNQWLIFLNKLTNTENYIKREGLLSLLNAFIKCKLKEYKSTIKSILKK